MSTGEDDPVNLGTIRGRDYPSIRQFSIFSPNRLGQLLNLSRLIESARLRVCAMSISDSADCAIIRLVVNDPERGYEVLTKAGYAFCEVDLVAVALPDAEKPVLSICATLLSAEIDVHYSYSLLVQPNGIPVLAFHVSDNELASKVLEQRGFLLVTENDLRD